MSFLFKFGDITVVTPVLDILTHEMLFYTVAQKWSFHMTLVKQ